MLANPPGPNETRQVDGVVATSPERTIVDALEAGTQPEQIETRRPAGPRARADDAAPPARGRGSTGRPRPVVRRSSPVGACGLRYGDAVAFRQALEQRLRTHAAGEGARLGRDRKRIAFDRLLARLEEAAPDRWLLKGGFALDLRLADRARTTRDVDIEWQAAEDELHETLIEAAALTTDDFFSFAIERAGRAARAPRRRPSLPRHRQPRWHGPSRRSCSTSECRPSGRRARYADGSDLLAFAEVEPIDIPVIPLERHLAEKLHAYTRRYRDDRPSSRAKDLVDIVLIRELKSFELERLRTEIVACSTRGRRSAPPSLPSPPRDMGAAVPRARRGGRARSRTPSRTPPRRGVPRRRPRRRK